MPQGSGNHDALITGDELSRMPDHEHRCVANPASAFAEATADAPKPDPRAAKSRARCSRRQCTPTTISAEPQISQLSERQVVPN
jgi:hypothetical protein